MHKLALAAAASSAFALSAAAQTAPDPAARPNILFIYTDDQRWDCLSVAGHPFLKTPNIDRIATEGAYLENAFVTLPLCSPSRAAFLTGKYNHANGVVANTQAMAELSYKLDTWPQHVQKAGYQTAYVGKFHMGADDSPRPGFDHWASFKGQGVYNNPTFNIDGERRKLAGYTTDLITDQAVEFIKRDHAGKPFAMIVGHKAVHGPYTPAERHKDAYANDPITRRPNDSSLVDDKPSKPALWRDVPPMEKNHPAYGVTDQLIRDQLRCILAVDEGVGRLLKALEETKQLDNTLILFTSDNGYFWNEHHLGDKRAAYEESIRVPMVIRYPALIKPGTRIPQMVLNIDFAPTAIELAGAAPIPGTQGQSLIPLFKGDAKNWRTTALFEYFLEKSYPNVETWQAVRTPDWKLIRYTNLKDMDELYDLKNDPYELKNLIKDPAAAEQLKQLQAELDRLNKENR